MSRSPFGWSLPPGCTQRQIDDHFGGDEVCECCGHGVEDCICPECPVCTEHSNPDCYAPTQKDLPKGYIGTPHGLEYNTDQLIGQAKLRITRLKVNHQELLDAEQQTLNELVTRKAQEEGIKSWTIKWQFLNRPETRRRGDIIQATDAVSAIKKLKDRHLVQEITILSISETPA